jgi:hypothetical protein
MEETSSKWSSACHLRLVASLPEGTDKLGYDQSSSPKNMSERSGTQFEVERKVIRHNMKAAQETYVLKEAGASTSEVGI